MQDEGLEDLAAQVVHALAAQNAWLVTAESCTGGLIGHLLTDTPGASAIYKGGVIAYANDVKERILGVRGDTLEKEGAVSESTAQQMVAGACGLMGAAWGIAVTGIAGPGGGTVEKPVGLVYIAVQSPAGPRVSHCRFEGNRAQIKRATAEKSFKFLLEVFNT